MLSLSSFGLSSEDLAGRLPQECGDLDLRRLLRAIDASKEGASQDASAEWSFERGGLKHVLRIRSRVVPRAT
ncbi:MAG: hypothetical protein HC882_09040, partial [Acidobacteria bacterium]|nr:hypothetical protein [Acidobacteriota bacterium]